jgi:hypothetical protein
VKHLFDKGVRKIIASDVDPAGKADYIRAMFKDYDFELLVVGKDDFSILYREADACCPCAVGKCLCNIDFRGNSKSNNHSQYKSIDYCWGGKQSIERYQQ